MKRKNLVFTLLLVVTIQLTLSSPTVLAAEFDITGRVFSDDRTVLSGVLISVYEKPNEILFTDFYTNADGYFNIYWIPSGTYDIVFEKKGYVTYTKTISSSKSWETINLGEVIIAKALQLSTTILSRVTTPGKTLVLLFTLSNAGEEEQECKLNITSPEGWKVKITDQNGELDGLRLPAGVTTTLNLEITVPLNATGENDINLRVSGLTAINWPLTIKIEEEEIQVAELKAKYPSQSVPLGTTANYPLTIENPSQSDELFDLFAPSIPAGWELVFKADEKSKEIGAVLIGAKETEILTVEITPSLNSTLGEYLIPIEAISTSARGSITLKTIVSGSYNARVRADLLFVEIQAATTETVTVTVTNTGYSPLTNVELLITSIPSSEWTVETTPLKQTTLNPNEAVDFQIYIRVPAEAARGDYLVELQPSMDQIAAEELESLEIRVTVNPETAWGIYGLALVMAALAFVFLVIMKFRRK